MKFNTFCQKYETRDPIECVMTPQLSKKDCELYAKLCAKLSQNMFLLCLIISELV